MELLLASLDQGMIADVVCLLIVAIFSIVSLAKGFMKQAFKIVALVGSFVIAYFFCDELLAFVDSKWNLSDKFATKILALFSQNEAFSLAATVENVGTAIKSMGLPQFIADAATNALANVTTAYANIGEFLVELLTNYILMGISYIIILILSRLILGLIGKILSKIFKLPVLRGIDRILGFIYGAVIGIIVLYIGIYTIDVLPFEFLTTVKDALSNSMIGAYIQNNNLFAQLITWAINTLNL